MKKSEHWMQGWMVLAGVLAMGLTLGHVAAEEAASEDAAADEQEAVDEAEEKGPKLNIGGIDQQGGTIKGIVKYASRKYNTKKKIDMAKDKFCAAFHPDGLPKQADRVYGQNGDDVTLQNVFVWVSKGVKGKKFKPTMQAVLDQVGCMYTPHVSGVVARQKLTVRNSDKTTHNVNAKIGRKPVFNKSMPAGSSFDESFKKPAEVQLKCDVHPWMTGYIRVLEHPFFAVTQKDGTFEIRGLPPGEYEVSVWHEYKRYKPDNKSVTVTLGEDETKQVVFTYKTTSKKKKKKK